MKTKLKLSFTLFLSVVIFNSYSQKNSKNNCNYSKNSVDEFTKKIDVRTKPEEIFFQKKIAPPGTYGGLWCKTSINIATCNINGENKLLIFNTACSCDDQRFYKISF